MKKTLKMIIPPTILDKIKVVVQKREMNFLYKEDKKRFKKYSASVNSNYSYENIRSQIMYFSHQIEKGLSRKNFRYGFGLNAITNLVTALEKMKKFTNWEKDSFYINGISSLKAYSEKHKLIDGKVPNFEKIPKKLLSEIENSDVDISGVIEVTSQSKENNSSLNFKELAKNRISIRVFKSDKHINMADLKEVVEICIKTPSVCNRQASRVKIIEDTDKISKILALQGGFGGYELPDKLLLVTSDLSVFLRSQERNQAFVDGGLFCMSLLYALEYKGIGACPLSVNIAQKKTNEVRKILDIPESETLIMFVACGVMNDKVTSPKSYRRPLNEITKIF